MEVVDIFLRIGTSFSIASFNLMATIDDNIEIVLEYFSSGGIDPGQANLSIEPLPTYAPRGHAPGAKRQHNNITIVL